MSEALRNFENTDEKGEVVVGEVIDFLTMKNGSTIARVKKIQKKNSDEAIKQYEDEESEENVSEFEQAMKLDPLEEKLIQEQEATEKKSSERRRFDNAERTRELERIELDLELEAYKQEVIARNAERRKKRALKEKRTKRKQKIFVAFCVIVCVISVIGFKEGLEKIKRQTIYQEAIKIVENVKAEEEFKDDEVLIFCNLEKEELQLEPDRNIAWSSELPKFMLEDIKLLNNRKNKNKKIKYEFENTVLWVYLEDGRTILSVQDVEDNSEVHHEYVDFSVYFNDAKDLIIYGYSTDLKDPAFYREKVSGIVSEVQTVAQHSAVPFNSKMVTMELSDSLKEYLMEFMKMTPEDMRTFALAYDERGNIGVYHRGEPVTNIRETGGVIKTEKCLGLLLNKDNNLIFPYFTVSDNGGIIFKIANIGTAEGITDIQYAVSVNGSVENFPIIRKEASDFVVLPKNMDTYAKYCANGYLEEGDVLEFGFENVFSEE